MWTRGQEGLFSGGDGDSRDLETLESPQSMEKTRRIRRLLNDSREFRDVRGSRDPLRERPSRNDLFPFLTDEDYSQAEAKA